MIVAQFTEFAGSAAQLNPQRLADGFGVDARNIRVGSADMRPWNLPLSVHTIDGAQRATIYRGNRTTISDTYAWCSWTGDVDVLRSMLADDSTERTYYTGDGVPKVFSNVDAFATAPYPTTYRTLGVPKPASAMTGTITVAGVSTTQVTSVYVDTFLTDRGEESAPSTNPVTVTHNSDATITLNGFATAPGGSHGINRRRIYRSDGGGSFYLIAEFLTSTSSYVDTGSRTATVLQSGGAADKPAWLEPPASLTGLIELWNGMAGGFVAGGKEYRVCVPYKPHAWPDDGGYTDIIGDNIVATGKWLQNWLILTTDQPHIVNGNGPTSLNRSPVEFRQACASKRSVVSFGWGVVFASPQGLCSIGSNGMRIITEGILRPEQWEALNPASIIGGKFDRFYLGFYNDGTRKGFILDPLSPAGIVWLDQGAHATYFDPLSERLYLLDGGTIKRWAAGAAGTATFKTAVRRSAGPTNAGFAQIVADTWPVTFSMWADGVLKVNAQAIADGEPFALPDGYIASTWQVQVSGAGNVLAVTLAEDIDDLP